MILGCGLTTNCLLGEHAGDVWSSLGEAGGGRTHSPVGAEASRTPMVLYHRQDISAPSYFEPSILRTPLVPRYRRKRR